MEILRLMRRFLLIISPIIFLMMVADAQKYNMLPEYIMADQILDAIAVTAIVVGTIQIIYFGILQPTPGFRERSEKREEIQTWQERYRKYL